MSHCIRTENLVKIYKQRKVVNEASFNVKQGESRVIRGGSYGNNPFYSRIAYRMPGGNHASANGGFRLAHP
jgi:ABC-type lipopolysaccharide export system ATPase subunit